MQQTLINLKQRIDKNYKELQRKYKLTKVVLEKIDSLILSNASNETVSQWLQNHDNIIFSLEYNLKNLEK
ncbi:MAG: hypothetical protein KAJ49_00345 [Arcobacteraceae bacterium]|nr:hypothetical protein [Arcobacteraceae bacterium]